MKTWLLIALDDNERIYRGHFGYKDDLRSVYRYDSLVPNHKQLSPGDAVILRGRERVLGCALIQNITSAPGIKLRMHCPACGSTKLKERKRNQPRFRCRCGASFDSPEAREETCIEFAAEFGATFQPLGDSPNIRQLWSAAPRLNKQLAMLELDNRAAGRLLRESVRGENWPDSPPAAAIHLFREGERTTVLASRIERDPRARAACVAHYGSRCFVCGFDSATSYGPEVTGVIEVHHLERLADCAEARSVDPVRDLRPLCPNCHTVAHRKEPPFALDELKAMMASSST